MTLKLELVEPLDVIEQNINRGIADLFNKKLDRYGKKIKLAVTKLIPDWINNQPEVQSLLAVGAPYTLSSEFGIPDVQAKLAIEEIIISLIESINVVIDPIDKNLNGGINFNIQPNNFANLLAIPEGTVITEKGEELDWMDWLLTQGDTVVVYGYRYKPANKGRAGGRMVPGGSFRVDPKYSGNINDNFIVRALSYREQEISRVVQRVFSV